MDKLLKMKGHDEQLDILFKEYLKELNDFSLLKLSDLKKGELPQKGGIYVFFENGKPIYVGRTKNIRTRVQSHKRTSSTKDSASFTFNLAKMNFEGLLNLSKIEKERNKLMANLAFKIVFDKQKERVKDMDLKYIIEEHDILQTMLEPYLAYKLGTYPEYNKFETH